MAIPGRRALTDHKEVKRLVDEYFEEVKALGEPPIITELALKLDISRASFLEYRKFRTIAAENKNGLPSDYEETCLISDILDRASQRCEALIERNMLTKKLDTTSSIFNLKSNYKWDDGNKIMIQGDPDKPLALQDLTETAIKSLSILEDYNYEPTELPQIDEKPEVSEDGRIS